MSVMMTEEKQRTSASAGHQRTSALRSGTKQEAFVQVQLLDQPNITSECQLQEDEDVNKRR